MKTKSRILITAFIIVAFISNAIAQQPILKGKAFLVEFTNTNAKFTVPAGKTWTIYQTFTASWKKDYFIYIKSLNGVLLTNLYTNELGPLLFSIPPKDSNRILPLILPENTTIELFIFNSIFGYDLADCKAYLNYVESDN